jgi:cysteine desulfurase
VRTRVSASASDASHGATVGVPASPPPKPAGLHVSTPGLIAGALFGGGPFLAWLMRRNDEDAPGNTKIFAREPGGGPAAEMSTMSTTSPRETPGGDRDGSRPTVGAIGAPLPNPLFRTCVYLDYNATTPVFPEVARAAAPFVWDHFGNPSSGHAFAEATRDAIAKARSQVATCVGCAPDEIVFTSCGSESDNHAIASAVEHFNEREKLRDASVAAGTARNVPHVVTSAVEHPAILEYLIAGEKRGELTYTAVPVDHEGIVDPAAIGDAVGANTCLLTLMHANNEVGAVQPVAAAARAARAKNARVLVHCDAAQSLGKIDVRVSDLEVDYLTIVGHKIGAPKGVAATFARRGAPWRKLLHGGGQESGRRAGTENVVHIAALGAACALVDAERERLPQYMEACTDELRRVLRRELGAYGEEDEDDGVRFNGPADAARRLPNTVSVGIKGVSASVLLDALKDEVAASAGAACHSDTAAASISGVLVAMGVPEEYAVGTVRLSVGRHTTVEDVERGAARIVAAAKKQRADIDALPEGERPWWCVRKHVGMVK